MINFFNVNLLKKINIVILFSSFIFLLTNFSYSETPAKKTPVETIKIAILDLKPQNISEGTAISLTDVLRTELINTGLFSIVERDALEKILKEQELQATGLIDTSQAVELGKLTAAKKLIMGSVGDIGGQIIVNVRVVDIESGAIEVGDKQVAYSESDIIPAVEEVARKIASKLTGKTITVGNKRYFATNASFSEIKVLNVAVKNVMISAGTEDGINKGDKFAVYIVDSRTGKEQIKAKIKAKKISEFSTDCKEYDNIDDSIITSGDFVRKLKPEEE